MQKGKKDRPLQTKFEKDTNSKRTGQFGRNQSNARKNTSRWFATKPKRRAWLTCPTCRTPLETEYGVVRAIDRGRLREVTYGTGSNGFRMDIPAASRKETITNPRNQYRGQT